MTILWTTRKASEYNFTKIHLNCIWSWNCCLFNVASFESLMEFPTNWEIKRKKVFGNFYDILYSRCTLNTPLKFLRKLWSDCTPQIGRFDKRYFKRVSSLMSPCFCPLKYCKWFFRLTLLYRFSIIYDNDYVVNYCLILFHFIFCLFILIQRNWLTGFQIGKKMLMYPLPANRKWKARNCFRNWEASVGFVLKMF